MADENSRVVRTLPPLSPANKQSPGTKQPRKKRRPQTGGSDREAAASGDESGSPKTKKVTSPKGKQNKTPTKTGKRTPRKKTVDGNTENEESPAPGSARRKAKPKVSDITSMNTTEMRSLTCLRILFQYYQVYPSVKNAP